MATNKLYPIQIPFQEWEIIKGILSDRMDEIIKGILFERKDGISSIMKQFADKNNEIYLTSFQNGLMMGVLSSQRNTVPECWKQLIDISNIIRKDGGVEVTDLGNDMIQLKDSSGFSITRQKYEWE